MDGDMVAWRWTMAASLVIAACGGKGEGTSDGTSESSAVASTEGSSAASSSGEATTGSASGSESTTSASTDASAGSAEQGTTDEPGGPCLPGDLVLGGVVLDVITNRVMGDDLATPYDPAQGSTACVQVDGSELFLFVRYGPFGFDEPQSVLQLRVAAVGLYDLATDAGIPASGIDGAIELNYSYEFEPASTASYDTKNQVATGTVDVVALPQDGGTMFEFAAQGEIAGTDGWQFDLTFTGTVVPAP